MDDFRPFKSRLETEVLRHPIIVANPYTTWFERGEFSVDQARAFLIQFSVFSNQFLVAQLQKVLNAETLEEMRASKEILANEIGVGFLGPHTTDDAELGSSEGSIEGGTLRARDEFFSRAVHRMVSRDQQSRTCSRSLRDEARSVPRQSHTGESAVRVTCSPSPTQTGRRHCL